MLLNTEGDDNDHDPVVEDDGSSGNCGSNNDRNIQCRKILTPLDINITNNTAFSSTTYISISHMMQDK